MFGAVVKAHWNKELKNKKKMYSDVNQVVTVVTLSKARVFSLIPVTVLNMIFMSVQNQVIWRSDLILILVLRCGIIQWMFLRQGVGSENSGC